MDLIRSGCSSLDPTGRAPPAARCRSIDPLLLRRRRACLFKLWVGIEGISPQPPAHSMATIDRLIGAGLMGHMPGLGVSRESSSTQDTCSPSHDATRQFEEARADPPRRSRFNASMDRGTRGTHCCAGCDRPSPSHLVCIVPRLCVCSASRLLSSAIENPPHPTCS